MTTLLETHGAVITLDHLPVWQGHNTLAGFHKLQGQSADYAMEHGGYAVEERDNQIRGYMAYMKLQGRAGYGVNGHVVRSIESLQAISLDGGSGLTEDYLFAENVVAPQIKAIRMMLNYTDGALSNINGALDSWAMVVAARFGLDADNL